MLILLRGLAKAHRGGLLVPSPIQPGAITREYAFSGDPRDPEIAVTEGLFPAALPARPLVASPGELGRLPRIPAAYLIGYPVLPVGIEGSEDTVRALLVADLDDGTVMQGTIPDPPTLEGALRLLGGIFSGRNLRKQRGLPREAVFADRELHDAFASTLKQLGVVCSYEPGRVTLENLLFGGSVVATDRLLAESAETGICLVAATYAAGDFTFLVITGPPLGAGEVLPALRCLEGQGLDPSPKGIGATSNLFGRLWSWLERERAARPRVPQMANFDGDPPAAAHGALHGDGRGRGAESAGDAPRSRLQRGRRQLCLAAAGREAPDRCRAAGL